MVDDGEVSVADVPSEGKGRRRGRKERKERPRRRRRGRDRAAYGSPAVGGLLLLVWLALLALWLALAAGAPVPMLGTEVVR